MQAVDSGTFDAIVVGTGPGGATVARDLSRSGKKVLILEWGPGGPIRGNLAQYARELMVPGKSLLITNRMLGLVRGITTGGSSVFYYGTCFPVPLAMFASRGVDLAGDIEEIRRELPIARLRDEMITPMAGRLMESAQRLGFNWQKLEKFMFQDRWKPEYRFGYYGDPNGVKWSARMHADDAVAHGAVLINGAKVTRVIVENGTATGVEYLSKGEKHTVSAPVVVISAGGIGSPLILRSSGIAEAGYDFFFDPLITVCGTIKDVALRNNEIPMSAGVLMKDEGYVMTDMAIPPSNHLVFTAQVMRLTKLLAFRHTARIMVKVKDTPSGRLTERGGVRKKLSGADLDKLLHGYANARRILREAGATDIYKTWYLAAHPGGTVKIGQLVDADLQTQYRNLYVCDCSVIPEAWGLPPVMTVLALGRRLARHLGAQQTSAAAA
ncbi:MAG: GMC family oxidoreductase [Deltaproteobacteria bacterium]|nr:GMC family oxidoreductase [Deltaproteobacteria bacterium]